MEASHTTRSLPISVECDNSLHHSRKWHAISPIDIFQDGSDDIAYPYGSQSSFDDRSASTSRHQSTTESRNSRSLQLSCRSRASSVYDLSHMNVSTAKSESDSYSHLLNPSQRLSSSSSSRREGSHEESKHQAYTTQLPRTRMLPPILWPPFKSALSSSPLPSIRFRSPCSDDQHVTHGAETSDSSLHMSAKALLEFMLESSLGSSTTIDGDEPRDELLDLYEQRCKAQDFENPPSPVLPTSSSVRSSEETSISTEPLNSTKERKGRTVSSVFRYLRRKSG